MNHVLFLFLSLMVLVITGCQSSNKGDVYEPVNARIKHANGWHVEDNFDTDIGQGKLLVYLDKDNNMFSYLCPTGDLQTIQVYISGKTHMVQLGYNDTGKDELVTSNGDIITFDNGYGRLKIVHHHRIPRKVSILGDKSPYLEHHLAGKYSDSPIHVVVTPKGSKDIKRMVIQPIHESNGLNVCSL